MRRIEWALSKPLKASKNDNDVDSDEDWRLSQRLEHSTKLDSSVFARWQNEIGSEKWRKSGSQVLFNKPY